MQVNRVKLPGEIPPSQMLVECGTCDKPVIAEPGGYVIGTAIGDHDEGIPRWTLLRCEKKHPILVIQYDWSDDQDAWHWDDPVRIYPSEDRELSFLIPEQLRQIHDEARRCYRAKAYTAAAVMSGRALEAACALNGIKEQTLQKSLVKMKELGHIDGRLGEWADTLRSVRNSAAHYDSNPITKQDAEDAIAFDEALLDYLYVLTARFEALKARREKSTGSKAHGSDSDSNTKSAAAEASPTESEPTTTA